MTTRQYTIKWKETDLDGVHYRSILEARWHLVLKELGIIHTYEPKTFYFNEYHNTPLGIFTPDYGLVLAPYHFVEIKPTWPTDHEKLKCKMLSEKGYKTAILAGPCSPYCKVLRWENGHRKEFRKTLKFYAQCFLAGLSSELGENIVGLKAVLGEHGNFMSAFEKARSWKR